MPPETEFLALSRPARRAVLPTLVVAAVVAAFAALYLFRTAFFLLFVGIVFATAVKPLVRAMERRQASHPAAVGGVYLTLALLAVAGVLVLGPLLLDQMMSLAAAVPAVYDSFREDLLEIPSPFVQRMVARLPPRLTPPPTAEAAVEQAVVQVSHSLGFVGSGLKAALALAGGLMLAFYWSLQEERTIRWLLLFFPVERREAVRDFLGAVDTKVGAYLRGQAILCLIVAALALVAFWFLGLPYAIVLAAIAGIMEAVPFFGPILGAIPAILVALATDPSLVLGVIISMTVIQQLENHLLVPQVMDRAVGVNPLVTLLAIAAFGTLMGLAGAILAIPLAAIAQLVLDRFVLAPEAVDPAPPQGRDAVSVLRYQTQKLIHDVRLRIRDKTALAVSETDRVEEVIESIARDLDQDLARRQLAAPAAEAGS